MTCSTHICQKHTTIKQQQLRQCCSIVTSHSLSLQCQGKDSSGLGSSGGGARVTGGTLAVQVSGRLGVRKIMCHMLQYNSRAKICKAVKYFLEYRSDVHFPISLIHFVSISHCHYCNNVSFLALFVIPS